MSGVLFNISIMSGVSVAFYDAIIKVNAKKNSLMLLSAVEFDAEFSFKWSIF